MNRAEMSSILRAASVIACSGMLAALSLGCDLGARRDGREKRLAKRSAADIRLWMETLAVADADWVEPTIPERGSLAELAQRLDVGALPTTDDWDSEYQYVRDGACLVFIGLGADRRLGTTGERLDEEFGLDVERDTLGRLCVNGEWGFTQSVYGAHTWPAEPADSRGGGKPRTARD